jgi:hypothetical protein
LPYANFGAKTILEKVYNVDWKSIDKLKHTFEPFAYYNYVPNIDQSDFPVFDQLDRINARSLATFGFISRLYAHSAAHTAIPQGNVAQSDVAEEEEDEELAGDAYRAGRPSRDRVVRGRRIVVEKFGRDWAY